MLGSPPIWPELLLMGLLIAMPFAVRAARDARSYWRTKRRLEELKRLRWG
jgi:hypothetical protein